MNVFFRTLVEAILAIVLTGQFIFWSVVIADRLNKSVVSVPASRNGEPVQRPDHLNGSLLGL